MKRQIRYGVFETNSSSVHSLTIVDEKEFEAWKNGEMIFDGWDDDIKPLEEAKYDDDCKTYDEFMDNDCYETFERTHTTKSGDKVVAFGYYGHD